MEVFLVYNENEKLERIVATKEQADEISKRKPRWRVERWEVEE